ncbi:uncharacterized protein STEHIDRAFT_122662 [Stereum hirsutum FP-91666 SS1]|uniref:uncharacterized protein n=1 Tax=Stereum hirsutum (strain FP-91666) TaxID=721885 RepID=UPI000444950B|nr:uncharacterized protein STEHIDRAFT_122662 [Stereum hirsutum FP-91666 SS1]EIM85732.1 hypothetical protein STEHIDRAFT_122662 [Stereum hirsutum FP-91666 SS1]
MIFQWLADRPNRVLEKQRQIQAVHRPVHIRTPYGPALFNSYRLLFTVGMASTAYGAFLLVQGKK